MNLFYGLKILLKLIEHTVFNKQHSRRSNDETMKRITNASLFGVAFSQHFRFYK